MEIHIYIYAHTYTLQSASMYVYTYILIYIHTYIHTYIHVYTYDRCVVTSSLSRTVAGWVFPMGDLTEASHTWHITLH